MTTARIEITLGGSLIEYLPAGNSGNRFSLEKDEAMTLAALLAELGVPQEQRLLVIINGQVVQPADFATTLLCNADQVALMPPITAG